MISTSPRRRGGLFGIMILYHNPLGLKDFVSLLFVTLRPDNPGYTADTTAPDPVFEGLFGNMVSRSHGTPTNVVDLTFASVRCGSVRGTSESGYRRAGDGAANV